MNKYHVDGQPGFSMILWLDPVEPGFISLSLCGRNRMPPHRMTKMMMVFVANHVLTVK